MSTENEGTAVPAALSAPPVPVAASGPASDSTGTNAADPGREPAPPALEQPVHNPTAQGHTSEPQPGYMPVAQPHAAAPGPGPAAGPTAGPGAGWPPPPPAHPTYGGGGSGDSGGPAWGAPMPPVPPGPRRKRTGGLVAGVLAAALVAGGVGGGIGYWAAERNDSPTDSTTVSASGTAEGFKRDPGTVAAVAAKALPSVVTIEAQGGDGEGGTGTGFVYDVQGHIVTNNHVVASAADGGELSVTFSNGKKYDAEVVGRAEGYDVAVLKLKSAPAGLAPLPLGDSDKVAVGDSTIAIGAPFGLSNTVTTGIISAKNRPVASGDGQNSKASYMSALQTDASINPGNSGGPLLDARGAVIGINSAIQSAGTGGFGQSQAGSIGLGFAIPVNQAKTVAQQLIKTGEPVYPVIGATVSMDPKSDGGAVIADRGTGGTAAVPPDSPAGRAGLKAGDVITKLDDRVIDSGPTLISEIWTHKPGDKVTLTYERDGKTATAEVTLGQRKGDDS
ncbi:trypsin-like peptidase domain-containing protein [Streptomyces sp. ISL-96]|uniref:S1C family serine protease n=1 Tax=Streptomyces sp. ISL-96 TaxID=2819191 RepID=UPI001BE7BD12|nr:trypsin-like peptidase domain-containing protein [Streptomyces sp. ISL-96]MBT2490453.1 trypsin-like peptidase domain-containing protein [Streptomyces sp. ISL-96]